MINNLSYISEIPLKSFPDHNGYCKPRSPFWNHCCRPLQILSKWHPFLLNLKGRSYVMGTPFTCHHQTYKSIIVVFPPIAMTEVSLFLSEADFLLLWNPSFPVLYFSLMTIPLITCYVTLLSLLGLSQYHLYLYRNCFPQLKLRQRTSLVVHWLRICLLMQGTHLGSLVQELRSHMPQGN